eukprot:12883650-Prorocentrum_lima.AAC.1
MRNGHAQQQSRTIHVLAHNNILNLVHNQGRLQNEIFTRCDPAQQLVQTIHVRTPNFEKQTKIIVRVPDHHLNETSMTRDLAQRQTPRTLDHILLDGEKKEQEEEDPDEDPYVDGNDDYHDRPVPDDGDDFYCSTPPQRIPSVSQDLNIQFIVGVV